MEFPGLVEGIHRDLRRTSSSTASVWTDDLTRPSGLTAGEEEQSRSARTFTTAAPVFVLLLFCCCCLFFFYFFFFSFVVCFLLVDSFPPQRPT